jgi:acyl-CoA dehydrogenase
MNILQVMELAQVMVIPTIAIIVLVFGYVGVPLCAWTVLIGIFLLTFQVSFLGWVIFAALAILFNVPFVRRSLVTSQIIKVIKSLKLLPKISDTEQAAIEAGTVWVEGEFFSGRPDFQRLNQEPYPQVTPDLQAFLDHQVEQVCQMASDWDIYSRKDLPPEMWQYLKQEGFFGMMIPVEYGGLGFSSLAFSAVMTKLASRSFTHTATVGVTNSLGPAKLLMHYGTEAQKAEYLPRLARGDEIPCFALTEPLAGSDAASITSEGVVFEEGGKLYLRLNWKKRYITLGAIATLIGLAFQLKDPENLLGKGETPGITCALIPAHTPGVILNQRHDPMGVPFYNSPTEGHDVIISIEQIIGGIEQAGQGWKMLMQSLAAGRGISFPATCTGVAKLVTRVTGNYARVRRQFGLSIGRFEGIEEPLARIGGFTYLIDAIRLYTCGAVDAGKQPAVVSAIAKYTTTEISRHIINDGMDILGGAGICRGPRNLLANIYTATPIMITVEGANILTRSMIIFGQGAIRSHPYVYAEIKALTQSDLVAFDRIFWSHLGFVTRNGFRAVLLNLSRGYLAHSPTHDSTAQYYRKLSWASATFALFTDVSLIALGGRLKYQENLTGRFADILSWLYLGSATLRRYEAEGQQASDLPLVHWVMQYALAQIQEAFDGIFQNMPVPILGAILRYPIATWWRLNPIATLPNDRLSHQIAQHLQTPGVDRDRLTAGIHIPTDANQSLGRLEQALLLSVEAEPILQVIKNASRAGQLPMGKPEQWVAIALEQGLIQAPEAELVWLAESARKDAVQVDAFTRAEYQKNEASIEDFLVVA